MEHGTRRARAVLLVAALLSAGLAACATLRPHPPARPDPLVRLRHGLAALDSADYRAAYEDLSWVYTHHPDKAEGRHALLVLAAASMDPRNPERRLDVGARIVANELQRDSLSAWERPVLESMYLLSLELGAEDQRVGASQAHADSVLAAASKDTSWARADSALAVLVARPLLPLDTARFGRFLSPQLPRLPGEPVTARIERLRIQRDALQTRSDSLTQQVRDLQQQLTAAKKELERIRKALHG